MKLLFASDSFKGSLTSEKTMELLGKAAREVFGECGTDGVPVADVFRFVRTGMELKAHQ